MIEKYIEITDFCFKIGKPTTLGWVVLLGLVIVSGIGYLIFKVRR